jgi:hypothetical protein
MPSLEPVGEKTDVGDMTSPPLREQSAKVEVPSSSISKSIILSNAWI